jgi:hypothetical protein
VAVLLTRTDMALLALRAMFDLPFYLLVFGAAVLELGRRGAAGRCSRCSLSPGCCGRRPGCWPGVYWLWLDPRDAAPAVGSARVVVVAAPLLWLAGDLIVTGEPLYSLTSTREVSGQFGRNRGLLDAITLPAAVLPAAATGWSPWGSADWVFWSPSACWAGGRRCRWRSAGSGCSPSSSSPPPGSR